jgi:hypothetical protein
MPLRNLKPTFVFLGAAALLFQAGFAEQAQARLGETEAQCQARYGVPDPGLIGANEGPLMAGSRELAYNYQGWRIRAAFFNGTVIREDYVKIPDAGGLKKIEEAEVLAVLDAEKGTFNWREEKPRLGNDGLNALKTVFDGRTWQRSDHAVAKFKAGLVLVVETHEAEAVEKRLAKQGGKAPARTGPANPNLPKF